MIIFLYGADTFRSRRKLQELKNKFIKEIDDNSGSLEIVDGQSATLKEIGEKINTGSLFIKKRLIVIENIFKNKKDKIGSELTAYLQKIEKEKSGETDNILIFWDEEISTTPRGLKADLKKLFTYLNKQKYTQEFIALTNGQILSFIKQEANSYQKDINAQAASLLITLTGGDLWLIASEIKKLAFRQETEKIINIEDIKEMVAGFYSDDIFALTDALSAKNKSEAIRLLEEQYAAGLSDEYIIVMLIRQFKILLQIRSALDNNLSPNEITSRLKLHPYVIKKGLAQARNFQEADLKNYLNILIHLDFCNKNGISNIKSELTMLIAKL
ncbi:MAG: DNA polymerase III subunit delta [Patescibacteria group bacterium]